MSTKLSDDELEDLGTLIDRADNGLAWHSNSAAPLQMRYDALLSTLTTVRKELKRIYLESGGQDEWPFDDKATGPV